MPIAAVTAVAAAARTLARRDAAPALAELPKAPNPVTPASAAVHIMRVPLSRLLEGIASLQQAATAQAPAAAQVTEAQPAEGVPSAPVPEAPPPARPDLAQRLNSATLPATAHRVDLQA